MQDSVSQVGLNFPKRPDEPAGIPSHGSRPSVGEVVAFPGCRRPTESQLRSVLAALIDTGPISVRHLKMEAGLSEDLLLKCVERLAGAGLLTAEDRKDGNALRLIVSATDTGRRFLAAGVEDGAVSGNSPERGAAG